MIQSKSVLNHDSSVANRFEDLPTLSEKFMLDTELLLCCGLQSCSRLPFGQQSLPSPTYYLTSSWFLLWPLVINALQLMQRPVPEQCDFAAAE